MPCIHDRHANKSPGSDNHVRLKFLHDSISLPNSAHSRETGIKQFEQISSVQPLGRNQFHRIAGLGYNIFFQANIVSDIENFRIRFFFFNFVCNSNGRIDMSAGASSCYNYSHHISSHYLPELLLRLEIFKMIPIDPMRIQSALPP